MVKTKAAEGIVEEIELKNSMPLHLGTFLLSNSKKIRNKFILAIDGLKDKVYYRHWFSLHGEKICSILEKTGRHGPRKKIMAMVIKFM